VFSIAHGSFEASLVIGIEILAGVRSLGDQKTNLVLQQLAVFLVRIDAHGLSPAKLALDEQYSVAHALSFCRHCDLTRADLELVL